MSAIATLTPCSSASTLAWPKPMPDAPPVTKATFPLRSCIVILLLLTAPYAALFGNRGTMHKKARRGQQVGGYGWVATGGHSERGNAGKYRSEHSSITCS